MVQDLLDLHPLNLIYLSSPIMISSIDAAHPNTSADLCG